MRHATVSVKIALVAMCLVAMACVPREPGVGPPAPTGGYDLFRDSTADTFEFATVFQGLNQPVNLAFAPDGRAFVAEQMGIIKTYDSVDDPTPTITADLRSLVSYNAEHGLVGLTVDRAYPTRPYVYAFYATDPLGLWGDGCASGYQSNGCRRGGSVDKITVDGNGVMVGQPETLVDDRWCFQFTGHSVGSVEMLSDGSLVITAGEGAKWDGTDYGQWGGDPVSPPIPYVTPANPCGDPPGGEGVANSPTDGEGGSFRSQDVLTDGDPVTWDGALARIDADTGEPMPDNPLVGSGDTDDDGVVAFGYRNPNRITVQPGTDRVYVANVGQNFVEEIEWVDVTDTPVKNSGWPCREGAEANPAFDLLGNVICEDLITAPGAKGQLTDPWFYYNHNGSSAAVTGLSFVPHGPYPEKYHGDLFFADYVIGNIWAVSLTPDGNLTTIPPEAVAYQPGIVDLDAGPDDYLYSVNRARGTVDRLVGAGGPPIAKLEATPPNGPVPLQVNLDASSSSQPGGGALTFAWDLDGDGQFDDGTGPTATATFNDEVNHDVAVQVTGEGGATAVATQTIYPGNTAPEVVLDVTSPLPWTAGQPIEFQMTANDAEDGPLPGTSITWESFVRHCYEPTDCHSHPDDTGTGNSGSFTGPSHGYPSYIQLVARATDSRGQTTEVSQDLQPATATITVTSSVPGAAVTLGEALVTTPATYTAILGDSISVAASNTQAIGGVTYAFDSWSDGGARTHQVAVTGDLVLQLNLTPL